MKFIAVVGRMHSGKTTFSKAIKDKYFCTQLAFADPVKQVSGAMLATFDNFFQDSSMVPRPPYEIEEINRLKGHPAIRKLLQLVGTELGREYRGPDTLWIDLLEKKFYDTITLYRTLRTEPIVIVDDCRFPNEAERLSELGFVIVKLIRDEDERRQSVRTALIRDNPTLSAAEIEERLITMLMHPSETEVDHITPHIIVPSLNVVQLAERAHDIVSAVHPEDIITTVSNHDLATYTR